MIGELHCGDIEMLWRGGRSFIYSRLPLRFGNYSLPARFNCLSEQGVEGLEVLIDPLALQPVPSLSGSCMGGERHEHPVCTASILGP